MINLLNVGLKTYPKMYENVFKITLEFPQTAPLGTKPGLRICFPKSNKAEAHVGFELGR